MLGKKYKGLGFPSSLTHQNLFTCDFNTVLVIDAYGPSFERDWAPKLKVVRNNRNAFYSQSWRGAKIMTEDKCLYAFLVPCWSMCLCSKDNSSCITQFGAIIKWFYTFNLLHEKHKAMLYNVDMLGSRIFRKTFDQQCYVNFGESQIHMLKQNFHLTVCSPLKNCLVLQIWY